MALRRREAEPDPAALLEEQARLLSASADRVMEEAANLAERERALSRRELRIDEQVDRETREAEKQREALAQLARELDARRERVEELEAQAKEFETGGAAHAEREAQLASGELAARRRSDDLERRERRLAEREDELHAREARLLADELGLRRRADELAVREEEGQPARAARPAPVRAQLPSCVLFVPGPEGYRLVALEASPPAAGERVEIEGSAFDVVRLGPSPLPNDDRRCVYLAA